MSGNRFIIILVGWYSGWPKAFSVPDKTAKTVADSFIDKIFPRFGSCLQLVTDNVTEDYLACYRNFGLVKDQSCFD